MSEETLYDVVPERDVKFNDTDDGPKAWITEVPLERAVEALEEANEQYAEYEIEFALKESTGDRSMTQYRKEQVEE